MASEYSQADLAKMQTEAMRRVREMQGRAGRSFERAVDASGTAEPPEPLDWRRAGGMTPLSSAKARRESPTQPRAERPPREEQRPREEREPPPRPEPDAAPPPRTEDAPRIRRSAGSAKGFGGELLNLLNLRGLALDEERLPLILVFILLATDGADEVLLLAMLYILL